MDYLKLIHCRYQSKLFVNEPIESEGSLPMKILHNTQYNTEKPYISIVMPVHNQETIIANNIASMFRHTTETFYELILIVDSCSDNTEQEITKILSSPIIPSLVTNILVIQSTTPLFETSCDNIGFLCSRGKYILEIQADMEMTEEGYNMKLLRPFKSFNNLVGVSGRCCHGLTYNDGVGKLGGLVEKPLSNTIDRNTFYISETCNRGPLMLDTKKVRELGYLDEKNYFLDNSDHDFFVRAYAQKHWICGYMPIEFHAPLSNGTTRKPRDPLNERFYTNKRNTCREHGFLQTYLQSRPSPRHIQAFPMQEL
jgi:glycosyltransferase involved in cell wall biosynthesis